MIRSEFAFRSRIVVFWLASSFVTCRVCSKAGAPRRIALFRFSPLPARAVPNSLISSVNRSRNGSRRVLRTRSF